MILLVGTPGSRNSGLSPHLSVRIWTSKEIPTCLQPALSPLCSNWPLMDSGRCYCLVFLISIRWKKSPAFLRLYTEDARHLRYDDFVWSFCPSPSAGKDWGQWLPAEGQQVRGLGRGKGRMRGHAPSWHRDLVRDCLSRAVCRFFPPPSSIASRLKGCCKMLPQSL